jgi:hypothetical protein
MNHIITRSCTTIYISIFRGEEVPDDLAKTFSEVFYSSLLSKMTVFASFNTALELINDSSKRHFKLLPPSSSSPEGIKDEDYFNTYHSRALPLPDRVGEMEEKNQLQVQNIFCNMPEPEHTCIGRELNVCSIYRFLFESTTNLCIVRGIGAARSKIGKFQVCEQKTNLFYKIITCISIAAPRVLSKASVADICVILT